MPTDAASPRWSETTQLQREMWPISCIYAVCGLRDRGVCGVGVVGGAARCPSSEAKMYGSKYVQDRASVRSMEFGSVRSSEVQMY